MKKVFIVLIIALMSQSMIAQANKAIVVPQQVAKAFSTQFPQGKLRKWEQRKEGYIADFRLGGKKVFAYYSADGAWKGTETTIATWLWNLPDSVRKGWKKSEYSAWKVEHITKIDQPDQQLYSLDVSNSPLLDADHSYIDGEEWVLFFNLKGELVRKYQAP